MVYILETDLNKNKPIFFALTKIYGININTSTLLCQKLGFSKNLKIKNLTDKQLKNITFLVNSLNLNTSSDLKKLRTVKIKKLISIKSYRGLRRLKKFPVRGQRTRSNANTAKKLNFKKKIE